MKLANGQTEIPKAPGSDECLTFADLVRIVVEQSSAKDGVTVKTMRINLSILDKCDEPGEELEFNSAETTRIKELLESHKWGANHKDLLAFHDAIEAADS